MAYRGLVPGHSEASLDNFEENKQRKSFQEDQIRRLSRGSVGKQLVLGKETIEVECTCDDSCKETSEMESSTSKKLAYDPKLIAKFDSKFVDFPRMKISHNDSHVIYEDFEHARNLLKKALEIRARYMMFGGNYFSPSIYEHLGMPVKDMDYITEGIDNVSRVTAFTDYDVDDDDDDEDKKNPKISPWDIIFPPDKNYGIQELDGVFNVYQDRTCQKIIQYGYPNLTEFRNDMRTMINMIADGPLKTYCYRRLTYLGCRFSMHILMNDIAETAEHRSAPTRDFYNIRKVDTHVHGSTCMNRMMLLRFLRKTMKEDGDEVVLIDDKNRQITLSELFASLNVTKRDLTVDVLDEFSQTNLFERYDKYAIKYNPMCQSRLRNVYLSLDNQNNGKYFGQILRNVMKSLEESKYQHAEIRLPLYGRTPNDWIELAKWAINHNLHSPNVMWVMQVSRLYNNYNSFGLLKSFQEMLDNLFLPVFEATNNPNQHPELHSFLQYVVGFDSVADESYDSSYDINSYSILPKDWTTDDNPSYGYYIYYMYANITVLNQFRASGGWNKFTLRPHCGSAGSVNHLVFSYMMADSISHGIQLRMVPVLQYLYYLTQIGISMSPLSNNNFFVHFNRNPFPDLFNRGLNVCLSTDNPLSCHYTKEPLIEEYSVTSQVWKLSPTDMAEIAKNSVMISGFPHKTKQYWLGVNYLLEDARGNDISLSRVPDIRVAFRYETRMYELNLIFRDE